MWTQAANQNNALHDACMATEVGALKDRLLQAKDSPSPNDIAAVCDIVRKSNAAAPDVSSATFVRRLRVSAAARSAHGGV